MNDGHFLLKESCGFLNWRRNLGNVPFIKRDRYPVIWIHFFWLLVLYKSFLTLINDFSLRLKTGTTIEVIA